MPAAKDKTAEQLRYDARYAFLDGRTKLALKLNKQADALDRAKAKALVHAFLSEAR